MSYLKVRNHDNLVRDSHSKAVLNTDRAALEEYYVKLRIEKKIRMEQEQTKQRIATLEQDMSEIKDLLKQIAVSMRKE
jgi:uncharacterized protein (UPF0276 family)